MVIGDVKGPTDINNLMFARELDRRSRAGRWGILSNAAHPGATRTNLQITGPTHNGESTLAYHAMRLSMGFNWMWQNADQGILPALFAATSIDAQDGTYLAQAVFLN